MSQETVIVQVTCPRCGGSGKDPSTELPCRFCNGAGKVEFDKRELEPCLKERYAQA